MVIKIKKLAGVVTGKKRLEVQVALNSVNKVFTVQVNET